MMHNTCLNSAVSLRCRYSPSSQFNDPTYFLDARFDTNPLLISSSYSSCCCCCCAANSNVIYNSLPTISPRYLFNGLRQSTLIQFAPSKRLIFHGSRRQSCNNTSGFSSLTDSDRNYYYEKLHSFKEKRKLGKGRCWGIEDSKKEQSFTNAIDDYVDDVEILLDLLTEEVGLENISVRERRSTDKKDRKTKTVGSGFVKRDKKHDNKTVKIQSMKKEDRRLIDEKKEEERRTFVKRVNREQKKEGSSCSSYYSVSSTGEFDSDNDVEIKHDVGESSSEYKDDQRTDSYTSYNEENVERQNQVVKEKGEILKKNTAESYYGNQEWRKKSEKKLDLESSQQQSQVSLHSNRSSQQSEKTDRITNQFQSRTDNKINTSVQNLTTADRVTQKDQYRNQLDVISEASRIHEINTKKATSSLVDSRIKDQEHNKTEVIVDNRREEKQERIDQLTALRESRLKSQQISRISDNTQITKTENSSVSNTQEETRISSHVEDRREEKQERIDHLTTLNESRLKSQQISRILDNTQITKTQNSSVSNTQSDIRSEKQELDLKTSSSSQKVTMAEQIDLRRKKIEDKYSSSEVKLVEGTTESMKSGRRTTKASSFHVGMPKEASSSYKALKLNPEPNVQQSGTKFDVGQSSQHFDTTTESSRLQQSEILGLDTHSDVIDSANQEHKASTQFLGEFVKNANNKLLTSQEQEEKHEHDLVYEDAEQHEVKSSDKKDGPSDEMWDVSDNITTSGEASRKSGRSLWNVIGDVVRLRWTSSSCSETHTVKSGGEKAPSINSGSEAWFSGHEHEDSNDENAKTGIKKDGSRRRKDDSPLLSSSSSKDPNHGSSSKTMSPSVIEELSFPVPAIRMRRSPVLKSSGSGETDASGSGKMVNSSEVSPASSSGKMVNTSEVSPASSSGKMVIMDEPISAEESKRRKLARIDQVSKDRFDEWEEAYDIEAKQRKNDEFFMREALLEAKKGADFWEVPVGAVLVHDGKIIARGYNLVEELRDSTAHAEMICIREGSNNLRSWRLSGTTLYVTLEPCPMCAGAILQARVDTVVWGAPNKLLGADGSWIRLFPDGDGGSGSDKPAAPVHPFHPNMKVRRGVLSSECADVMQQFFQLRRKKKEKKIEDEPPTPPPSCLPITHRHNHSKFFSKMHGAFNIMFCL